MRTPSTLVDLFRWRAAERPEALAFSFLADGERVEATLTYGELERQARAIAAALQRLGGAGERAVLLYPPDLRFIAAFFGCLYAGATAVPVAPPRRTRPDRMLQRFRSVVADARPRVALTVSGDAAKTAGLLAGLPEAEGLRWLNTDSVAADLADEWREPAVDAGSIALLQYTSGSSAAPKGVMVSHGNVLRNERMIQEAFGQSEESVVVGWLPFYHDMGLMGNVIQPVYAGCRAVLMSPMAFLQRPIRWPQAVSTFRGTTSGGPSFAYDLAVRRTTPEQRASLDLGGWSVAFNGAEPVRSEVMADFVAAFGPCGFRREAFHPCYGLAEATLLVSAGSPARGPSEATVDGAALEDHEVAETAAEDLGARTLVSCGRIRPDQRLVVASPESLTACPPDRVGEIWLFGPNVAQGYWGKPEETEATFGARLADTGDGPFLRTGDLGFVRNGELYVSGRLKDLIIVRGKNHYPQDVEWTVQQSHPWLRRAACAAFSVDARGEERLVVLAEVDRRHERDWREASSDAAGVVEAVRRAVSETHDLQVYAVFLVRAGELPKTTSGKIERHACRSGHLDGVFAVVESSVLDSEESEWSPEELDREVLLGLDPVERRERLVRYLRDRVAAALRVPRAKLDLEAPLHAFGLDSLTAIELSNRIESDLGVSVSMMPFLQGLNVTQLAVQAMREMTGPAAAGALTGSSSHPSGDGPLSHGQEAIWFLQRLAPESSHYNIAAAARIAAAFDLAAFERALERVVERHAGLRTTFSAPHGKPVQRVAERGGVRPELTAADDWSDERLNEAMAQQAYLPFDLERGPLLRVHLFRRKPNEHVAVLSVHHLVADFWSLTVLMDELGRCYAAEVAGSTPALEPLPLDYAGFVAWQAQMVAGPEGEASWQYWQGRLTGALPELNLPTDRPRPLRQTYHGASRIVSLGVEPTRALDALAGAHATTLYCTLVAAFQALLHRYTGQEDVSLGSPMSGRTRAALSGIVGYFVNPVVLRGDLSGDPTFEELLVQTRRTVLEALEHQDYPFALLVERLQPARDPSRSPLFQVMLILQKSHQLAGEGLSSFALGEAGAHLDLWGLPLESMALEKRMAPFDLTLTMARSRGRLSASFEYNTDLFDAATMARLADCFLCLLEAVSVRPGSRLSELPLMRPSELQRLLVEWNGTRVALPPEECVHHPFEAQAERIPDAVAVVHGGRALTYRELNRRANRLARHLVGRGAGPQTRVGIYMERSVEMLVALLGVSKAGAAYVPLDPAYPRQRTALVLEDSQAPTVLTQRHLAGSLPESGAAVLCIDSGWGEIACEEDSNPAGGAGGDDLAYVIYTSGSTGRPKGVMVRHRSVVSFFEGMDRAVGCDADDTLLAVTSISFDISVLELLWTLGRGARVAIASERAGSDTAVRPGVTGKDLGFSLFYFANADPGTAGDKYRLLLEGAKFGDRHGFEAVWTPERHFHGFGGLYPSPSVAGAAVAAVTERIQVRAGSVVLPLQEPIRVAEEWSVVDNLSRGRVGVSFASGWHVNDFVLAPDNFENRKALTYNGIETVRRLWRGETIRARNGAGEEIEVAIQPRPLQEELPIWLTCSGNPDTFVKAGELGTHVLTHLLGQTLEEVAEKVVLYRASLARHGHDPGSGRVTLMLHTFVGPSLDAVREKVRDPLTAYLRTSVGLIASLARGFDPGLELDRMDPADMSALLGFAFERYVETGGLLGTPETCLDMVERARAADVDEIACLIDFGVDVESVLESLHYLDAVRRRSASAATARGESVPDLAWRHRPSLFQCTPSLMKMMALEAENLSALCSLRALMLGGEGLPPSLVETLRPVLPGRLLNMYGPTETTIWSTTAELDPEDGRVTIGRPIANTRVQVLDRHFRPLPVGVAGELAIGGEGLARGYLRRPALTAERFAPDPFGGVPGSRLYRTGDLASWLDDGRLECLGRADQQVKIRGFRVELGEIEAVLGRHPAVREAVVVAHGDAAGTGRLVAYVVPRGDRPPGVGELRSYLRKALPDFMVPGAFVTLEALPLTPNGKVDRKALPAMDGARPDLAAEYVAPESDLEQTIADIWRQVLKVERVGIHDNFFDLGGHSLLVAQVQSQLKRRLHKDLPLIKMLEYPTVSALTRHLSDGESDGRGSRRGADRAGLQRAGLWRQRQVAMASRRAPVRRDGT
jgi:natural product biosynthesis luciferase-like monooxygenase protein